MKTVKAKGKTMTISKTRQNVLRLTPDKTVSQNGKLFDFIHNHTHSLESVVLKNFKMLFIKNIIISSKTDDNSLTRRIGEHLILSDDSAMLLCNFNINRFVTIDGVNTYVNNIQYDETKSYTLECPSLTQSHIGGGREGRYDVMIYKYQDPVVRMVCEYFILLHTIFYEDTKYNIDTIYTQLLQYKEFQIKKRLGSYTYNSGYSTKAFWRFIREIIMGLTSSLNPVTRRAPEAIRGDEAYREGVRCAFGLGRTNCCEETLHGTLQGLAQFRTSVIFDTSMYEEMKSNEDYKSYVNMSNEYPELFETPAMFVRGDEKLKKFISIYQEAINIIIITSGRAEGKGTDHTPYPPISVFEVLDVINRDNRDSYVWIIRSERFHLAKSPCVHLGLNGFDITSKLIRFFSLEEDYESDVILHSIGHCLDRLYCGHTFSESSRYSESNEIILRQIIGCFEIFLHKMQSNPENPDENFNKLILDNLTPEILFLVSINDQITLEEHLQTKGLRIEDIFVNPDIRITDLYNVNYSFTYNSRNHKYTTSDECWDIKKKYQCKKYLIKQNFGNLPLYVEAPPESRGHKKRRRRKTLKL